MPSVHEQHCEFIPASDEDDFAKVLMDASPWVACRMIRRRFREGRILRDDALALLLMHEERIARELYAIELEIMLRDIPEE